jgi:hypothetical protein
MTPQTQQYLKYGGYALGALLLYNMFFGTPADNSSGTLDPTGNGDTTNPTVQGFNAKNIKSILFDAMNQFGTDEDGIISALQTVSQAQFKLVSDAFGLERYSDYLGYKTSTGTPRDLKYWLKAELSGEEYTNLHRKYPKYL